jgi:hypothetical protein
MSLNIDGVKPPDKRTFLSSRQITVMMYGGLVFILSAFVCIAGLVGHLLTRKVPNAQEIMSKLQGTDASYDSLITLIGAEYASMFLPPMVLLFAALLTAFIGFLLLKAAGTATKEVIPQQDYELLSRLLLTKPDKGIDHYVRLSSLTGVTGIFTKIGLTGLPLATISLTFFFTILSIPAWGSQFFDLAKLTLGAFIGSYVQKSVSEPFLIEDKKQGK